MTDGDAVVETELKGVNWLEGDTVVVTQADTDADSLANTLVDASLDTVGEVETV